MSNYLKFLMPDDFLWTRGRNWTLNVLPCMPWLLERLCSGDGCKGLYTWSCRKPPQLGGRHPNGDHASLGGLGFLVNDVYKFIWGKIEWVQGVCLLGRLIRYTWLIYRPRFQLSTSPLPLGDGHDFALLLCFLILFARSEVNCLRLGYRRHCVLPVR